MESILVSIMGVDCTNGGITSQQDQALLLLSGKPEDTALSQTLKLPILELRPRRMSKIPMAVPMGETGYPMFGGHWVYTSDSRFPFEHPIPVHDRYEKSNA